MLHRERARHAVQVRHVVTARDSFQYSVRFTRHRLSSRNALQNEGSCSNDLEEMGDALWSSCASTQATLAESDALRGEIDAIVGSVKTARRLSEGRRRARRGSRASRTRRRIISETTTRRSIGTSPNNASSKGINLAYSSSSSPSTARWYSQRFRTCFSRASSPRDGITSPITCARVMRCTNRARVKY